MFHRYNPYWLNYDHHFTLERFIHQDKIYAIRYGENYYATIIDILDGTKNFTKRVFCVRQNENFRWEEHDGHYIFQCKKLKDVIGCEVFEFEVETISDDLFVKILKLKPNDQKIDVIRCCYHWKTIRLFHLDGWSVDVPSANGKE